MKRLILTVLLLFIVYSYRSSIEEFITAATTQSVCAKQIPYKLGFVDPQFNVTEEQVRTDIKSAAAIWNKHLGKEMFTYSENASLTIKLIYDERQRILIETNQKKQIITKEETELKVDISNFEQSSTQLKQEVQELNNEIEYWNSQGGAPEEEYKELVSKQKNLNAKIRQLNEYAKKLNSSTESINEQINTVNQLIENYNELLRDIPEEGVYNPENDEITIYFYDSPTRFIHTTAHELGHSLGLNHTDDPHAIMYPITSETFSLATKDVVALNDLCTQREFKYAFIFPKLYMYVQGLK